MKVFLGETAFELVNLVKQIAFPHCGGPKPLKAQIEQKEEGNSLSLSALTVELGYQFSPASSEIISPGS